MLLYSSSRVVTVISGKVHVTKRSANGPDVFFEPKKIADILVALAGLPDFVTVVNDTIRVTNTGTCELTYGVEQYVTVSSVDQMTHRGSPRDPFTASHYNY